MTFCCNHVLQSCVRRFLSMDGMVEVDGVPISAEATLGGGPTDDTRQHVATIFENMELTPEHINTNELWRPDDINLGSPLESTDANRSGVDLAASTGYAAKSPLYLSNVQGLSLSSTSTKLDAGARMNVDAKNSPAKGAVAKRQPASTGNAAKSPLSLSTAQGSSPSSTPTKRDSGADTNVDSKNSPAKGAFAKRQPMPMAMAHQTGLGTDDSKTRLDALHRFLSRELSEKRTPYSEARKPNRHRPPSPLRSPPQTPPAGRSPRSNRRVKPPTDLTSIADESFRSRQGPFGAGTAAGPDGAGQSTAATTAAGVVTTAKASVATTAAVTENAGAVSDGRPTRPNTLAGEVLVLDGHVSSEVLVLDGHVSSGSVWQGSADGPASTNAGSGGGGGGSVCNGAMPAGTTPRAAAVTPETGEAPTSTSAGRIAVLTTSPGGHATNDATVVGTKSGPITITNEATSVGAMAKPKATKHGRFTVFS